MSTYLLAGGGTAGHVNPLLAVADELRRTEPTATIVVVGTREGLESELVPKRGYELTEIERLPFPRRPSAYALRFPARYRAAVTGVRQLLRDRGVDVVLGFGGYAAAPVTAAAAREGVPYLVHEANAMPGLASRAAARRAAVVATTFPNTPLPRATRVGLPMRREITHLDRAAARDDAIGAFGLDPRKRTVLVFGGSLGARRINEAIAKAAPRLLDGRTQLLHIIGARGDTKVTPHPDHRVLEYCDRMDLAYAAADLVVSRAGAGTVCEIGAVGLPAIYVPYAVGNGEQRRNAQPDVSAGAAIMVPDAEFTPERAASEIIGLLDEPARLAEMGELAGALGLRDADARVAELARSVIDAGASGLSRKKGRA